MTDTDTFGPDPSDFVSNNRRRVMGEAVTSLTDDPEKAGRAYELGRATGDNPALIYGNLDNYEEQHKAALTSSLLSSNDHLREYLDADPMHAKLSNDDYPNLDEASGLLQNVRKVTGFPTRVAGSTLDAAMEGFKKGVGPGPLGSWVVDEQGQTLLNDKLAASIWATAALPLEVPLRLLSGGIHAGTEAAYEFVKATTGSEQLARDAAGMAEMQLTGTGVHKQPIAEASIKKAHDALISTRLWHENGESPPPGIDPTVDRMMKEQNDADVKNLDEQVKVAQKSATRLRDPDTYARFIRMRDEGSVSISAEAVARLYGDKAPSPEDGLLGWAPDIAAQLETAKASGVDVEVPTADLLAKIDPDVYKALHDDIRVRPSGITKNEAKLTSEQKAEVETKSEILPDHLPTMRASAGLEPLFSIGDRKLKIEKRPTKMEGDAFSADQWRLLDENGNKVGHLEITPHGSKDTGQSLYIDNVLGLGGHDVNSFGPSLIRDLLRQIKEAYPHATEIGGFRISGAREKAGAEKEAWIKLDDPGVVDHFREVLEGGQWQAVANSKLNIYVKPKELYTANERELVDAVNNELDRLVPKQLGVEEAHRVMGPKREANAVYQQFADSYPFIIWSLDNEGAVGTVRHEAIHHLRNYGFFTEGEWNTLTRAARDNEWIKEFNINSRYEGLDQAAKLEEAVADGFKKWMSEPEAVPAKLHPLFEKLKQLLDAIREKIKSILGKEPSWKELFEKVDQGEIGQREGNKPISEGAFKESAEEGDQKPLFRTPGTIGMTEKQSRLYAQRIREMHESDIEWSKAQAEKEQRKTQTAEWKAERATTREAVDTEMNARPDVAADLLFGRGELYGEKLGDRPKIAYEDLTAEERAGLPEGYVAKPGVGGAELGDLAGLVGYPSGKAMIEHLVAYNKAKIAAGMSAKAFKERMVDLETDRQMAGKHGDLEENILDAVKDQITSETQLNLISEEVLALGIRAGSEASINKADLKSWIAEKFAESPMRSQRSEAYLKAAGKAGTEAEIALLKEDYSAAYVAKQRQYMAVSMAKEARALEKEQKAFAKTAQKLGKRDVKGLDQEYQDVIQSLLWQAGLTPRRSMLEIQRSQAQADFVGLDSFIDSATGDGWAPDVAPDIIAGRTKPLADMTVEEFRDFKSAIDSLSHIGRQVEKINIQGKAEDFAAYRQGVIDNITSLPRRSRESQERGLAHRMFSMDASLVRMENIMKDLDLGEDMGPLVNATIRPLAEAKHKEYSLQESLAKEIKDLHANLPKGWDKTLKEDVPNTWFKDPSTGAPFKLSREDMINIMLNWGNKGNLKKFTHGYGSPDPARQGTKAEAKVFEDQMKAWLDTHATRDDWKFVQGVWDIYKGYRDEMETVWRHTSGTQPKLVEPVAVDTPHGQFAGGYYPLIRDQYMSPLPRKGNGEELFGPDYPNFNTPQGHLKERTGATYFVDFQQPLGRIPMRMQQVIHDIAYRAEVMATAKVIRDRGIKEAIINHYGKEYADQLEPWLQKTARGSTIDEANQKGVDSILRQARLNLVAYALPWNYVVTLTPDVGSINPKVLAGYYRDKANNDAIANKWSKEIPHAMYNMDRDFREAMQKAVGEGKIDDVKTKIARWGYGPVSWASKQFRTATFIEKFNEALGDGRTEADAAAIADTYVRERHGAVALHDLPSIMTTGEKGRLLTMFYGYFNTQYNLARTIPAHLRRGDTGKAFEAAWGSIIVGAFFGAAVANQAKEDDSWAKRGAKAIPLQLLGMVPFARELGTLAIEGIPPRTPMGTVMQSGLGAVNDVYRVYQKKPVESGVKHMAAVAGLIGGVPGTLQAGRTGQFLWDTNQGRQQPRNIYEWAHGIVTGEARLKKKGER